MHETERITQLNEKLGLSLDPSVIIQSHTPFAELVQGRDGQEPLQDKCVLVVGGSSDKCRRVAHRYELCLLGCCPNMSC
jgi:ribonucleotide monophosphatase NagD (HAD superfamily)